MVRIRLILNTCGRLCTGDLFTEAGRILCSAISGIEQALWDIKGKYLNIPVWQMLGGKCRDRIRMYAHITPNVENPTIQGSDAPGPKRE